MKTLIKRLIPKPLFNLFSYLREIRRLGRIPSGTATFAQLGRISDPMLHECFDRSDIDREWLELTAHLKRFGLWNVPRATGSDDLRPLYYLARHFRWRSVLEVGTHVGGSTVTLAFAMNKLAHDTDQPLGRITTIDILDVNDRESGPWREIGMPGPPVEILRHLELERYVTFIQSSGVDYLRQSTDAYDFAFLDGDHEAASVYQEIMLSGAQLNAGGIIALHDFAAERMFSSYENGWTIPGPYLAARRLLGEHSTLRIIPIDGPARLQWNEGSYLAILIRR